MDLADPNFSNKFVRDSGMAPGGRGRLFCYKKLCVCFFFQGVHPLSTNNPVKNVLSDMHLKDMTE